MSSNLINTYQKDLKGLELDAHLNRKLIQNENRLHSLFGSPNNNNKKRKINFSTDQKGINKEKNKKINKPKQTEKKVINLSTEKYRETEDLHDEDEIQRDLSLYSSPKTMISDYDYDNIPEIPHNKEISVIKVNQNKKKLKKASNRTTSTNLHSNKNARNNKTSFKPKKQLNISVQSTNRGKLNTNSKNNNFTKIRNDFNTVDNNNRRNRYFSPTSNRKVNVEEMMDRFQKVEDRKKEWLENQKKKRDEQEKRLYTHAPKINKPNKKINIKLKDDFLERQKMKDEQKKQKEEKLKEYLNKKREEEINKNNPLLHKKGKNKDNINSSKTLDKNKKAEIKNAINKMYEWEEKRKEKLNERIKQNNEKIEMNKHVPKINKRSASMAELNKQKYKEKNTFNRLAQKDPVLLEKRKLLEELYTPTFKPNINVKKVKPKKQEEENEENEEIEESEEKQFETKGITSLSNKYINDDDIQELYRNALFQNKNKIRSQSTE